jgi:RNA methyltransferase, TrmH family
MPSPSTLISSPHNPLVKQVVRLRDATHRRRQQRFLIEGRRELERAIACQWPVETVLFCPELWNADNPAWDLVTAAEDAGCALAQLAAAAFTKAAYRENPDGLLAIALLPHRALDDFTPPADALILVVEAIEKPGNIGALMRTANAAGCHALIISEPACDLFNPNAIRASQGAFFDLPTFVSTNPVVDAWLTRHALQRIITSPSATTHLWERDLVQPAAFILGAESSGLSSAWLCAASNAVSLPMAGVSDSLNVSATAAICLFEAVRQRHCASRAMHP